MSSSTQQSLEVTKDCVNREIGEAGVYHALLFKWSNGLHNATDFEREFGLLFNFVRDALETKYVLALAKLFAPSSEAGLWRLIQLAKDTSEDWIDLKRERVPYLAERSKEERSKFLAAYSEYEEKIKEIKEKINPYRNIQRAHNYPWRQHDGKDTWDETKKWLAFAEKVFVQAMDGLCESCRRVGEFYPEELDSEIKYFVNLVEKGLSDAKVVKEASLKAELEEIKRRNS